MSDEIIWIISAHASPRNAQQASPEDEYSLYFLNNRPNWLQTVAAANDILRINSATFW